MAIEPGERTQEARNMAPFTRTTIDPESVPVFGAILPRIRTVPKDRPWQWLHAGFNDLSAAWRVSLTYGAIIAGFSLALAFLVVGSGHIALLLPLTGGFALFAPLLAVGLYAISRARAAGHTISLRRALLAWKINPAQIGFFGAILLLLHLFWVRVATLLYALFFSSLNPTMEGLAQAIFGSAMSLPFLIVGGTIGLAFAITAFCLAVVSIPMLLDQPTNVFMAIATSFTAVRLNPQAMAIWAFIIAFLVFLGFATFFLGLIIVMPLIGHASWHAYRDLVVSMRVDAVLAEQGQG
jgi:uncharacterized membrane protein